MSRMEQIAIYSRKSKFTGKGESVENQIELCGQYSAVHYGEDAPTTTSIYEDEGFSGGNLERPQFKKMMDDAHEELNDLKVSFVSIKEQFDTSSPMGRAMMYIASVFSQLERETVYLTCYHQEKKV